MLVSMTSFPCEESRITTWDLSIALFYHVDEQLHDLPKHPEAEGAAELWICYSLLQEETHQSERGEQ